MFNRENWIEIWSTIRSNKLRSILTAFGVFWGIFILIIMLGSSAGFKHGLQENFDGVATNSAFMWSQRSSVAYKGYNAGRYWKIENYDIEGIKKLFPEIKYIAPRLRARSTGQNIVYQDKKASFTVFGDYPEYFNIIPIKITKGRALHQRDISEKRKVCIIGKRIRQDFFKQKNPINEYIRVNGINFKIVGVCKSKLNGMNIGSDPEETIFIPFSTLQKNYGFGNNVDFFGFTVHNNMDVAKTEAKVKAYLLKNHKLSPKDKKAVGGFNMQKEFNKLNNVFTGVDLLSWIVGLGTLLAGIIGVSNIMLIVIKERTKEIGIKRALGAQSGLIRSQILFESVLLTLFAGFIGLAFSSLLLDIVGMLTDKMTADSFLHFVPQANLKMGLAALFILSLGGVLAGLLPASKAINIKPIDALRDE